LNRGGLRFSVIVPTYARSAQLAECLSALAHVDYPRHRFEVIVVDDGGGCCPESVLAVLQRELNLCLLEQEHAGPAAARNRGAMSAKGSYLCFIDDDCVPARNWLPRLDGCFQRHPAAAVGGRTLNGFPDNIYSATSQIIRDAVYAYYNRPSGQAAFVASNNLAVATDPFHELGGFRSHFRWSEDRDFCDRWLERGNSLIYAPEVVVAHRRALTLHSLLRQQFGYGRGARQFQRLRCGAQTRPNRHDLRFYQHLIRYPFLQNRGPEALRLGALVVTARVAYAAGYLAERLTEDDGDDL
jgi:GT2 family glycosyltransferase